MVTRRPSNPSSQQPPAGYDATILSDPARIAGVRHAVEAVASAAGLGSRAVADVGLCVNEALANVMRHAYGGAKDRPIAVACHCHEDGVVVTIRDWGNGVDPSTLPPRPYDPLEPGGLGLICMREMLSEVDYVPQPDGMLLVMRQRKPKPAPGETSGGGRKAKRGHE